jgi:hypothetical protein
MVAVRPGRAGPGRGKRVKPKRKKKEEVRPKRRERKRASQQQVTMASGSVVKKEIYPPLVLLLSLGAICYVSYDLTKICVAVLHVCLLVIVKGQRKFRVKFRKLRASSVTHIF